MSEAAKDPALAWQAAFIKFRNECRLILGRDVPAEVPQLKLESQKLEPLYFKAQEFSADALMAYYKAKRVAAEALLAKWPPSAVEGMLTPTVYMEVWGKEHATRLVAALSSRIQSVRGALEQNTKI